MKKQFAAKLFFLLVGILVSVSSVATGEALRTPERVPPSTHWMQSMEASVPLPALASPSPSAGEVAGWLGWILAIVFFLALLILQLRMKRQASFLLRAGDRDHFLLPPAGNRRKRPR